MVSDDDWLVVSSLDRIVMNDPARQLEPPIRDHSASLPDLEPAGVTPRLSIRHVMIWTACCALCIALRKIWIPNAATDLWIDVALVINAVLAGTSLIGVVLIVECHLRKIPYFDAPGNWLLAINGIGIFISWTIRTTFDRLGFDVFDRSFFPQLFSWVLYTTVFLLCVAAYVQNKYQRGWNSVFAISAMQAGFAAASSLPFAMFTALFGLFSIVFLLLEEIVLIVVLVAEFRSKFKRTWIHWLGAWVELLSLPVMILYWIVCIYWFVISRQQ